MTNTQDTWPAGATYVFQGTVAETADAGTHIVSMTLTPGVGSEVLIEYGRVLNGNTATAQVMDAYITDGTNVIARFFSQSDTQALVQRQFPPIAASATNTPAFTILDSHVPLSGTMQLVLSVTTAAVSVTQTFSVACRIRGAKPTVVLNDTVGAFVATVNTDKVF